MAEGWAKELKGSAIEAYSAGVRPQGINPRAALVMLESGVDLSSHSSKHIDELRHITFDYVIAVCDNANQECPVWVGQGKRVRRTFDDPPHLAAGAKTEDEALSHYRRVRDEIKQFIETLPESLSKR